MLPVLIIANRAEGKGIAALGIVLANVGAAGLLAGEGAGQDSATRFARMHKFDQPIRRHRLAFLGSHLEPAQVLTLNQTKKGKDTDLPFPFLVGVTGFEPAASKSQTSRATNCATPRYSF